MDDDFKDDDAFANDDDFNTNVFKKTDDSKISGYGDNSFIVEGPWVKKRRVFQNYEFKFGDDYTGYFRDDSFAVLEKNRPLERIKEIEFETAEKLANENWNRVMDNFQKYDSGSFDEIDDHGSNGESTDVTPEKNNKSDGDDGDDGGDDGGNLG